VKQRAAGESTERRARVDGLLARARLALDDGALRRAMRACGSVEALEPGNREATAIRHEAERRAGRLQEALSRAREARRLERAADRRLIVARVAVRLGRIRRAYEAASEALASVPGSLHAAAIRDAAAAAIGIDSGAADDATVGDLRLSGRDESSASDEATVDGDVTTTGHRPH